MTNTQARILGAVLSILFIGLIAFLGIWSQNSIWNNGICDICDEGRWEFVQAVGHKSSTSYLYKCDHCGYVYEFSRYHREVE